MLRAGHKREGYQDKVEMERKSHDDFSEYVAHQVYAKKCSHATNATDGLFFVCYFTCIALGSSSLIGEETHHCLHTPLLTHICSMKQKNILELTILWEFGVPQASTGLHMTGNPIPLCFIS